MGLLGAQLQLRGALLPSFGETFGATESQLGLVATAASLSFLATVFAVGLSVSRLDARRLLLAALLGLGALLVAIGASPTFLALLGAFLIAGVGQGTLHAFGRPLLSDLYPSRRGRLYNLQDMAWAVGATLGPLVGAAAIAYADWRAAYVLIAVAFVPVAALVWRLDAPTLSAERTIDVDGVRELVRVPAVASMAPLLLLLSLVESGIFTWLPYYVGETLPREIASVSLSIYLAAYVPGRYAFSVAAGRVDNLALVLASSVLATGALVGFLAVGGYALLGVSFVVGFLVAGMFPTLLAWATNAVPEYSGPINALALGVSGIGFLLFPAVMGVVADYTRIGIAMALVVAAMGLFAAVAGTLVLRQRW